jgi:hypothetical protein
MRELVYLSQRKLAQFRSTQRSGGFWRRITTIGAKAPMGMGEVSFTLADAKSASPDLERVLKQVQLSAKWYEDEDVSPGEWVQFEALMNFAVIESKIGEVALHIDPQC